MFQLGQNCTFVNFVTFRCVDVDSFGRICLKAASYRFLQLFVQTFLCLQHFFSSSICAEGQQSTCFISLQYLIYDREIINVLSKWAICGFVSLSSIFFFPFLNIWNQAILKMRTGLPCNLWVFWINLVWLKWKLCWAIRVYLKFTHGYQCS